MLMARRRARDAAATRALSAFFARREAYSAEALMLALLRVPRCYAQHAALCALPCAGMRRY